MLKEGKIYKMKTDSGTSIVKLKEIKSYPASGMPADYLFEYQPSSIKPIVHPDAEVLFGNKDIFPIPEMLVEQLMDYPGYGFEEVEMEVSE